MMPSKIVMNTDSDILNEKSCTKQNIGARLNQHEVRLADEEVLYDDANLCKQQTSACERLWTLKGTFTVDFAENVHRALDFALAAVAHFRDLAVDAHVARRIV